MTKQNEPDDSEDFNHVEDSANRGSDEPNNEESSEWHKRPRGVLSPTDRLYLSGEKDYNHHQTELNRRQVIRERTVEAIRDFDLLWLLLDESEREKIVDSFEAEELEQNLASIVAFMYLGVEGEIDRLEDIFEMGIHEATNYTLGDAWTVNRTEISVDIDVEQYPDIDKTYERFKQGQGRQLTAGEIGHLVKAGRLDPEDLDELEIEGLGSSSIQSIIQSRIFGRSRDK